MIDAENAADKAAADKLGLTYSVHPQPVVSNGEGENVVPGVDPPEAGAA